MDDYEMVAEAPTLDHLLPAVRATALLPAAERLQRVRAECWMGYPKAHEALAKLEHLWTHPRLRTGVDVDPALPSPSAVVGLVWWSW